MIVIRKEEPSIVLKRLIGLVISGVQVSIYGVFLTNVSLPSILIILPQLNKKRILEQGYTLCKFIEANPSPFLFILQIKFLILNKEKIDTLLLTTAYCY